MKLLVGCPVADRNWILNHWYEHLLGSYAYALDAGLKLDLEFIFALSEDDTTTSEIFSSWEYPVHEVKLEEPVRTDKRDWSKSRLEHMVSIRNQLLTKVREISPDLFLSLDSDILLHSRALEAGIDTLHSDPEIWAVGLKAYLSASGRLHPNSGHWKNKQHQQYVRYNHDRVGKVDVLMAAKLMSPNAYNVDYRMHPHGEDIGWSSNVAKAGGKLYWDARYTNKHVMSKDALDRKDRRVGW